ncbi:hypothetical protein [Streptomyces sp. NPDC012508]|uniref:hypothetical protein n=1 Tax=Streptomyces sp. NPDC012508 TaxID=3364837 RepID=UPI00368F606E
MISAMRHPVVVSRLKSTTIRDERRSTSSGASGGSSPPSLACGYRAQFAAARALA